jgi:hypothetical protein
MRVPGLNRLEVGAGVAQIEIAPGWIDAVQKYVEGLVVNSIAAAESATNFFRDKVVERARNDENWASVADNITLWNDDGTMMIGVTDPAFTSLATLLEYGDIDSPPNPLFRTLTSEARDASKHMRDELESTYGPLEMATPKVKGMRYGR